MDFEDLRRIPLFAGLDDAACARVTSRTFARTVTADTVLAIKGQPCDPLQIIETGSAVALRTSDRGRIARIRVDDAPVAIDKATALAGQNHVFTWMTLTPCRVRALPRDLFLDLVQSEWSVLLQTARHLATQATQARADYLDAAIEDPATRVLDRLREMADSHGTIALTDGQEGLAAELGLSRVTVTRALGALTTEGVLQVRRNRIQMQRL
jgi:CRP/FNR family transcriptional regulator